MADAVDTKVIRNANGRYTVLLQNASDGTGETNVVKVDVSTLLNAMRATCTYTVVERIDYDVWGFNYVQLKWDAATDDEIATLSGSGSLDFTYEGGAKDPQSTTPVGDILLSTSGTTSGSGYSILLRLKLK